MEDASEKSVAMENRLWPMRELLGEMLLEVNKAAASVKEFERSLKDSRNRLRGLYGAARALELMNRPHEAADYYKKIMAQTAEADTDRKERQQARAFLGSR